MALSMPVLIPAASPLYTPSFPLNCLTWEFLYFCIFSYFILFLTRPLESILFLLRVRPLFFIILF